MSSPFSRALTEHRSIVSWLMNTIRSWTDETPYIRSQTDKTPFGRSSRHGSRTDETGVGHGPTHRMRPCDSENVSLVEYRYRYRITFRVVTLTHVHIIISLCTFYSVWEYKYLDWNSCIVWSWFLMVSATLLSTYTKSSISLYGYKPQHSCTRRGHSVVLSARPGSSSTLGQRIWLTSIDSALASKSSCPRSPEPTCSTVHTKIANQYNDQKYRGPIIYYYCTTRGFSHQSSYR